MRFPYCSIIAASLGLSLLSLLSLAQSHKPINKEGIYLGISGGTWFPDNKNKVLGSPPIIGFCSDFKWSKYNFGLSFDLIGWPRGKTREPVKIKKQDSILMRNEYFGAQIVFNYGRPFWETNRFVFEGIADIGYGQLTYYYPNQYIHVDKGSLVFSSGLSTRCIILKRHYAQLKAQYCIANYKLKDNVSTDFRGNYFLTRIVIGSISNADNN